MRKLKSIGLAILVCLTPAIITTTAFVACGCRAPSAQKQSVNTLFSLHKTVDAALDSYLDAVVSGTLHTNGVPIVLKAYADFQTVYNSAVAVAVMNTNAPPNPAVSDMAATFVNLTRKAKP